MTTKAKLYDYSIYLSTVLPWHKGYSQPGDLETTALEETVEFGTLGPFSFTVMSLKSKKAAHSPPVWHAQMPLHWCYKAAQPKAGHQDFTKLEMKITSHLSMLWNALRLAVHTQMVQLIIDLES
ncbi:hypothetical protein GUJ93_ZPchr0003g17044 [Zizania palustris]|uniref:Uncharacterized protein n=1 Tax=Zizania palustris TaxID=103762 RepID=A0A8J5SWX4_ZIZPA|nr:hypothetical protein GUJ93_ZPchr0003g17044 [Zizania palustris]